VVLYKLQLYVAVVSENILETSQLSSGSGAQL
jgi:hypothetical protein